MFRKIKTAVLTGAALVTAGIASVHAQVTDMESFATEVAAQGSTLVGYMVTAAAGALAVFGLILGVRYVIRIFKTVK